MSICKLPPVDTYAIHKNMQGIQCRGQCAKIKQKMAISSKVCAFYGEGKHWKIWQLYSYRFGKWEENFHQLLL